MFFFVVLCVVGPGSNKLGPKWREDRVQACSQSCSLHKRVKFTSCIIICTKWHCIFSWHIPTPEQQHLTNIKYWRKAKKKKKNREREKYWAFYCVFYKAHKYGIEQCPVLSFLCPTPFRSFSLIATLSQMRCDDIEFEVVFIDPKVRPYLLIRKMLKTAFSLIFSPLTYQTKFLSCFE